VDVVRFTADYSTIDLFKWCTTSGGTFVNVKPVNTTHGEGTGADSKCEDPLTPATSHLPASGCMRVPPSEVGTYRCPIDLRKASEAVLCARWVVSPDDSEDDDWTGVD